MMMNSLQNGARAQLHTGRRDSAAFQVKLEPSSSYQEVDEDMHFALSHHMYKAGNYKQALQHSNAVYARNPFRTDNLLLLGAIYYNLHDYDMCIAKNQEALQLEPCFAAECYGNMAIAWKEKGYIDLAIRYCSIAIEIQPYFADAWSNLASSYIRKGRHNEAAQCCRQAIALNPLLVTAHSNLGNVMKAQGFVQQAYSCYFEALRIQPASAIALSNLAGLFFESGDLNRALQYYKEAIRLEPTFADAYQNLGYVYRAMGMPREANVCYQRAVQTRPNYAVAFDDKCRPVFCLKKRGDDTRAFDEAHNCYILDFDPSDPINRSISIDDEISILSEKGHVACRDYPHSRHLCLQFPFDKTPHESFCKMCYCYVCDSVAPCKYWNGPELAHCYASDHHYAWKSLRNSRVKTA